MLTNPGPATQGIANVLGQCVGLSATNSVALSGVLLQGLGVAMAALLEVAEGFFVAGRIAALGSLYSSPKALNEAAAFSGLRAGRRRPRARVRRGRLAAGATRARATPASIISAVGRMDSQPLSLSRRGSQRRACSLRPDCCALQRCVRTEPVPRST